MELLNHLLESKILAEVVGFIAAIILIFSVSRKVDRELIIYQGVANFLWIIHFLLFNAIEGVIACTFGLLRNLFVFKFNSKLAKSIFLSIFLGFTIYRGFNVNTYIELFPLISIFIITYGILFSEKNKLTKFLYVGNGLFLFYAIHIESISAISNYILMLVMLTYRYINVKKELKET